MATKEPSLNEIANELKNRTEMTNQEIKDAAENVIKQYGGLITSRKAALIFYARNEHNLDLSIEEDPSLDIEHIVPEMSEVVLECTVVKVDKFTYYDKGEEKKGCDVKLKDDTGYISLMLWNEQVEEVGKDIEGEKVEIKDSYSKEYDGETQLQYSEETEIRKI